MATTLNTKRPQSALGQWPPIALTAPKPILKPGTKLHLPLMPEAPDWCCQTNAITSVFALPRPVSGSAELTPLSESSITVDLEVLPTGEACVPF